MLLVIAWIVLLLIWLAALVWFVYALALFMHLGLLLILDALPLTLRLGKRWSFAALVLGLFIVRFAICALARARLWQSAARSRADRALHRALARRSSSSSI